ncbi:MAG: hypothetical protein ACOC33_04140 [bacterium]
MIYTNLIKKENKQDFNNILENIFAKIGSFFSIFFAMSIVLELANIVQGYVLIFLGIFICLFLLFNEWVKVKSLINLFLHNNKSLFTFIISFILSVGLSGIGIYFWTNKSDEIIDNYNIEKIECIKEVNNDFLIKISKVQNKSYELTDEYKSLSRDLEFWQGRRAADLQEREYIRKQIAGIQDRIDQGRNIFNLNKDQAIQQYNTLKDSEIEVINSEYSKTKNKAGRNNFVSYIFFSLIIITEFVIIILNKNLAEKQKKINDFVSGKDAKMYIIGSKLLTSLYLSKSKNNKVNINNAKYSVVNNENVLNWDEIKKLYNLYINLGILSDGERIDNVLTNEILLSEKEAQKKFQLYFEKHFSL